MARPRKKIDVDQLAKLAAIGLSTHEMGAVLNCSADTLQRRYGKIMETGRHRRNASLKRKQYELAMAGNPTMLIWLGKQHLDQSDKREVTGKDGAPIQIELSKLSDADLEKIALGILGD